MKNFLVESFNITEKEATIFSESFERIDLKKGETFISCGKVSNRIGFLEKGLLKCTMIGEKKSVIDDFVFENQFVANYHSFLTQQESNKEISCLNDSVIKIITRDKLKFLGYNHKFVEQIARQVSETLFISTSKKLQEIKLLNAEERYLNLIKNRKRIIEEIPQYEIASYLNVSPETVSRIRKKISNIS